MTNKKTNPTLLPFLANNFFPFSSSLSSFSPFYLFPLDVPQLCSSVYLLSPLFHVTKKSFALFFCHCLSLSLLALLWEYIVLFLVFPIILSHCLFQTRSLFTRSRFFAKPHRVSFLVFFFTLPSAYSPSTFPPHTARSFQWPLQIDLVPLLLQNLPLGPPRFKSTDGRSASSSVSLSYSLFTSLYLLHSTAGLYCIPHSFQIQVSRRWIKSLSMKRTSRSQPISTFRR